MGVGVMVLREVGGRVRVEVGTLFLHESLLLRCRVHPRNRVRPAEPRRPSGGSQWSSQGQCLLRWHGTMVFRSWVVLQVMFSTPREQVLDLRWVQRSPVTAPSSRRCEEGDGADPGDDRAAPATPHLATLLLCGEFRCYRWPTRNDCMNQSCQQVESRGSIYSTFERLQYWQYSLLFLFHFLLSRSVLFSGSTPPPPDLRYHAHHRTTTPQGDNKHVNKAVARANVTTPILSSMLEYAHPTGAKIACRRTGQRAHQGKCGFESIIPCVLLC